MIPNAYIAERLFWGLLGATVAVAYIGGEWHLMLIALAVCFRPAIQKAALERGRL